MKLLPTTLERNDLEAAVKWVTEYREQTGEYPGPGGMDMLYQLQDDPMPLAEKLAELFPDL
jgi:hypothetical protein